MLRTVKETATNMNEAMRQKFAENFADLPKLQGFDQPSYGRKYPFKVEYEDTDENLGHCFDHTGSFT